MVEEHSELKRFTTAKFLNFALGFLISNAFNDYTHYLNNYFKEQINILEKQGTIYVQLQL